MSISVSYFWPVATPGSATAPTSTTRPPTNPTSSVDFNEVVAQLIGDGTSTSVVVTHNLQITVAELAQLWPEVRLEPNAASAPSVYVSAKTSNNVTLGFNGTFLGTFGIVRIKRPANVSR